MHYFMSPTSVDSQEDLKNNQGALIQNVKTVKKVVFHYILHCIGQNWVLENTLKILRGLGTNLSSPLNLYLYFSCLSLPTKKKKAANCSIGNKMENCRINKEAKITTDCRCLLLKAIDILYCFCGRCYICIASFLQWNEERVPNYLFCINHAYLFHHMHRICVVFLTACEVSCHINKMRCTNSNRFIGQIGLCVLVSLLIFVLHKISFLFSLS